MGQDRLQKNSGACLNRSGQVLCPRATSIDKIDDCVMNSERSALVRGSDPHPRVTVVTHWPVGDMWRALARRTYD